MTVQMGEWRILIRPKRTSSFVIGIGWLLVAMLQFVYRFDPNSLSLHGYGWIAFVLLAGAHLFRAYRPRKPNEEVHRDA